MTGETTGGRLDDQGRRQLDRFQMLRVIGRGGMGEVWLARDPKLGRDVAIKILSSTKAGWEAQQRFEREISSMAALNHPAIAQIYEAGEAVWFNEDGCERHVPYLVMEYVQGETISRCLDRGPLSIREALRITCRFLEGLAVAHDRYLVHRDIKPANIVVNDEGEVKLLDLGLARMVQDEGDDSSDSGVQNGFVDRLESPDASVTRDGARVGTPKYMSPEQASGKRVDVRTDIWSVGMVLFEMVTGERAIEASSPQQAYLLVSEFTLDRNRLPVETPSRLVRIIERCLSQDQRDRYHHARDLLHDVKDLLAGRETEGLAGETLTNRLLRSPTRLASAAAFGLIVGVAIWIVSTAQDGAVSNSLGGITPISLECESPLLTPAGDRFVYIPSNAKEIWIAPVSTGNAQVLFSADSFITGLTMSHDGQWVYFELVEGPGTQAIYRIPSSGGTPRRVTDGWSPAISPDGRLVAFFSYDTQGNPSLGLCRNDGSDRESLLIFSDSLQPVSASFSQDGQHVIVSTTDHFHRSELVKVDAHSGEVQLITRHNGVALQGLAVYHQENLVLWGLDTQSYGNPISATSIEDGGLTPIFPSYGSLSSPSLSADGSVLLVRSSDTPQELVEFAVDPDSEEPTTSIDYIPSTSGFGQPQAAPDGEKIVFVTRGADLWIHNRSERRNEHLVATGHDVFNPAWSPDGSKVVYSGLRDDQADLWIVEVNRRSGETLTEDEANDFNPCWHPTGDFLVWVSDRDGPESLYRLDLRNMEIKRITFDTEEVAYPSISPDGRYLVYVRRSRRILTLRLHRLTNDVELEELVWQHHCRRQSWAILKPQFSPDGRWLGFDMPLPDQGADIYAVPVEDPSSRAVRLTAMPIIGSTFGWWDWIDSKRLIVSISRRHDRLLLLKDADLWIARSR
jgi:serine/threonine protein kinase